MPIIGRRGLLVGLGGFLVAAPAIVRVASLMPIRGEILTPPLADYIAPLVQEFTVWDWDGDMPVKKIIALTEEQVMRGEWQTFYGDNAKFISDGAKFRVQPDSAADQWFGAAHT